MDVEGFLKGDSIFLAEYSANQKVMGMIKGYLRDSSYVADMTTPEGIYNGTITARLQKTGHYVRNQLIRILPKLFYINLLKILISKCSFPIRTTTLSGAY